MQNEATIVALVALASLVVSADDAPPRFGTDAQVVVLDLVAGDKKGKLVEDLKAEEVSVFEDGRACEILSFRLVRARPKAAAERRASAPVSPPPALGATAAAATPTRPSLVVLVFDRLSQESATLARSGALDLMKRTFPPDTWFAVFEVGYGITLVESFTTDAGRLHGAIERATRGDRDRRLGPLAPPLPPVTLDPEEQPGDGPNVRIPGLREVAADAARHEASNDMRMKGMDSLYAVLGVARALENVEGRKAIVYFAEAWALGTSVQTLYDTVVSAANRANVAVHTVDARGLSILRPGENLNPFDQVLSNFTAESRATIDARDQTPKPAAHVDGPGTQDFEKTEDHLRGPRLRTLAEDTGGLAIADTNDLGARLAVVADELALYYEIAYAPANASMDGRFRSIEVRSSRPGVRLRARKGYFAEARRRKGVAAHELPLLDALAASDARRDFSVRTDVLHFGRSGALRECVLLAEVPLAEVQIDRELTDDTYRGHLSLVGFVKDAEARVVARLTQDLPISGPLVNRDQALTESIVFRQTLPLAPGQYLLELAIQDRPRGAVSVSRSAFTVPLDSGLLLGSVTVPQRATQAPAETATTDPLRIGDLLLIPSLGVSVGEGSRPDLPVLVALWPDADPLPVELRVELRQGETVRASATPPLPAADAAGRVTWVGSIPAARLSAGSYELVVTARQGSVTREERTSIEIMPAPEAPVSATPRSVADPELRALLDRAGRYVVEYEQSFRNIVAEETYTQRSGRPKWIPQALPSPPIQFADGTLQIRTRADVVFVRLGGDIPWGVFRDVFEANGAKVRDRDERLQKLFMSSSDSALQQAQRILNESSRFNMGVIRTANIPTLPLIFLLPRNQSRFAFRMAGRRRFGGFEGIEVQFEEVVTPGLVNTGWGATLAASGRFWIEPSRGAILRSETAYGWKADGQSGVTGRISTEYRPEPTLGIFVPDEMKESYYDTTEATARYTNIRRFDVAVEDESFAVPEEASAP